ncbi:hypothetical protein KKF91_15760 [Myxococcota bacterium]|nr:hypothetical protein [Myxococcota bacterium]MBU1431997.1 hypothetical protein [Myxococcota bacterium]MBU1897035.1 hypothetical protein [Myxococcota bacterium]
MRHVTRPLLLLLLLGCQDARRWPHPTSPSGQQRVIEAAEAEGLDVTLFTGDLGTLMESDYRNIIILDHNRVEPEAWTRLRRWVEEEGGHLTVATREAKRPEWLGLHQGPAFDPGGGLPFIQGGALPFEGGVGQIPRLRRPKLRGEALVETADGATYISRRELGHGRLTLVAGEELLTNIGIAFGDNAELSLWLLRDGPVALIASWSLHAERPGLNLKGGAALPGLAHLALAIILLLLAMGIRLGRPRPEASTSRRAYVEHVRALGGRFYKSQQISHAAQRYAAFALERLGARRGGACRLAEQMGCDPEEAARRLTRLSDCAEAPPYDRAECLQIIREAAALLHDAQAPTKKR